MHVSFLSENCASGIKFRYQICWKLNEKFEFIFLEKQWRTIFFGKSPVYIPYGRHWMKYKKIFYTKKWLLMLSNIFVWSCIKISDQYWSYHRKINYNILSSFCCIFKRFRTSTYELFFLKSCPIFLTVN